MNLIQDWKKAHKALSVLLPFIATTIALLLTTLMGMADEGIIDVNTNLFWGYALTILSYLGRIIPQVGLFLNIDTEKDK